MGDVTSMCKCGSNAGWFDWWPTFNTFTIDFGGLAANEPTPNGFVKYATRFRSRTRDKHLESTPHFDNDDLLDAIILAVRANPPLTNGGANEIRLRYVLPTFDGGAWTIWETLSFTPGEVRTWLIRVNEAGDATLTATLFGPHSMSGGDGIADYGGEVGVSGTASVGPGGAIAGLELAPPAPTRAGRYSNEKFMGSEGFDSNGDLLDRTGGAGWRKYITNTITRQGDYTVRETAVITPSHYDEVADEAAGDEVVTLWPPKGVGVDPNGLQAGVAAGVVVEPVAVRFCVDDCDHALGAYVSSPSFVDLDSNGASIAGRVQGTLNLVRGTINGGMLVTITDNLATMDWANGSAGGMILGPYLRRGSNWLTYHRANPQTWVQDSSNGSWSVELLEDETGKFHSSFGSKQLFNNGAFDEFAREIVKDPNTPYDQYGDEGTEFNSGFGSAAIVGAGQLCDWVHVMDYGFTQGTDIRLMVGTTPVGVHRIGGIWRVYGATDNYVYIVNTGVTGMRMLNTLTGVLSTSFVYHDVPGVGQGRGVLQISDDAVQGRLPDTL